MKTCCKFFLIVFICIILFPLNGHAAVTIGQAAPDFTLEDTNGNNHTLSDYEGSYVVLEWINFDCPFVKKHYGSGNMQNLQKTFGGNDVVWLSISSSAHGNQGHYHPDEANQLIKESGASPTAYLMDFDGDVGRIYAAKTTPHIFIINPEGSLIYQGAIDSVPSVNPSDIAKATNYVVQALNEAMAGQPISIPVTIAYGCSVKY